MEYSQFVTATAEKAGVPEKQVKRVLDAGREVMIAALQKDEKVRWKGIGTFEKKTRAPRQCRNMKTGEKMMSAESSTIRLSVSETAKTALQ